MSIYLLNNEDQEIFESLKTFKLDAELLEEIHASCCGIYNSNYGNPQSDFQKQKQSEIMKGYTIVKNKNGETLKVSVEDQRLKTGELVGIAKDKVSVKDKQGNYFLVDKTDPRYISGELVGVNKGRSFKQKVPSPHKGTFLAKDRNGNMCRLTKNDPRYISGEYIHFRSKF